MAVQASHYIATYDLGLPDEVSTIDLYGKDAADAKKKLLMIHPNAQNIVVSSAPAAE
jgi:hypothetical protein